MHRQIYRSDGTALQPLAPLAAITVFCLSDGIVDAHDRGRTRVVAEGLSFPNGIVITPGGKTLIVGETMNHRLTAFDVQADGSLANRRVYAPLPEDVSPDGIALDAEGAVWLANPEGKFGVLRVREGDEIVERVELDTEGHAVMLGGPPPMIRPRSHGLRAPPCASSRSRCPGRALHEE
jgi:hypothetical protein